MSKKKKKGKEEIGSMLPRGGGGEKGDCCNSCLEYREKKKGAKNKPVGHDYNWNESEGCQFLKGGRIGGETAPGESSELKKYGQLLSSQAGIVTFWNRGGMLKKR